jgi:hypothetical protein
MLFVKKTLKENNDYHTLDWLGWLSVRTRFMTDSSQYEQHFGALTAWSGHLRDVMVQQHAAWSSPPGLGSDTMTAP